MANEALHLDLDFESILPVRFPAPPRRAIQETALGVGHGSFFDRVRLFPGGVSRRMA